MQDKIRIDLATGLYVEPVQPDETGEDIVETPCFQPFNRPKWTGAEWVEGGQAPEPTPQGPTVEERLQMAEDTIMFMLMGSM